MTTPQQKFQFSSFKASFSSNVSALKRRFSSGDLENEAYEEAAKEVITGKGAEEAVVGGVGADVGAVAAAVGPPPPAVAVAPHPPPPPPKQNSSKTTSAPTSPSRSTSSSSIFQRLQSVTGAAREVTSSLTNQVISSVTSGASQLEKSKIPYKDPNTLVLLVIDEHNTDWSKYFPRSRKINNYEICVEQCEFSELSLVSYESHTIASYLQYSNNTRQLRQFIPDFLLIRQNLRDAGRDYKNLLLALMYGGLHSVNSLPAIYSFQDKPWVFAHLMNLQRKMGKEHFPLIDQNFYPDWMNMGAFVPRIPSVLKIGHAHGGLGKIRVGSLNDYQDASSVVAVTGTYCTSEPYIESRCDVHVQKIGNQYKAFMRKGIVGHWKSGSGSAMLEQVPMNERYRSWVDNVATMFGGLDVCALEVLIGKDGREWIIEVNDSALSLMGESQEEDRRHIAELVCSRMSLVCKMPLGVVIPSSNAITQPQLGQQKYRRQSGTEGEETVAARRDSQGSTSSTTTTTTVPQSASAIISNKLFSRQNSQTISSENLPDSGATAAAPADTEDTMKNLRKTFAGIFGDM